MNVISKRYILLLYWKIIKMSYYHFVLEFELKLKNIFNTNLSISHLDLY